MKEAAIVGAGATLGLALSSCAAELEQTSGRDLEQTLADYKKYTKVWDPVYGPYLATAWGRRADFDAHFMWSDYPGLDYDVAVGTPIVLPASGTVYGSSHSSRGGLNARFIHLNWKYQTLYSHLSEFLIDSSKYHNKKIGRNVIVALSGASGEVSTPHLHFSLMGGEFVDPEKYGIDGGPPTYWDCKTNLDIRAEDRSSSLEKTLENFENELNKWPEGMYIELKSNLLEYFKMLGNIEGTDILDSKHFHDMRGLLKRITLEDKIYTPGTEPYSLMLKIVGYSTDEKQKIILTLPFIAPGLESTYKIPVLEEG